MFAGAMLAAAAASGQLTLPDGVPFKTSGEGATPNIIFTSQWDAYSREVVVPLCDRASHAHLLMAGSTEPADLCH